ncbi:MAG: ferredoxin [Kiritimatiellae bacterium]|nr:ferredoxin [Kiritimatiellia bacterium]
MTGYRVKESVAEVIATPVPPPDEPACREAADSCPVAAITITE